MVIVGVSQALRNFYLLFRGKVSSEGGRMKHASPVAATWSWANIVILPSTLRLPLATPLGETARLALALSKHLHSLTGTAFTHQSPANKCILRKDPAETRVPCWSSGARRLVKRETTAGWALGICDPLTQASAIMFHHLQIR